MYFFEVTLETGAVENKISYVFLGISIRIHSITPLADYRKTHVL